MIRNRTFIFQKDTVEQQNARRGDGIHLIKTLESIREAVLGGELDTQIESAANIVKSRFKK